MKRFLFAVLAVFLLSPFAKLQAQETINVPDTLKGWDYNWIASLNGTQAQYSNWSPGGVSSVSATGGSSVTGKFRKQRYAYGFIINLNYGRARIDNQGVRKTDDRIAIRNRWTYTIPYEGSHIKLFATAGFISQFDEGFEYEKGPNNTDIKISDFLAPGYITQNAGLEYSPTDYLSFDGGVALKQTIVTIDSLATLYGVSEGENFRNEAGFGFTIDFEKEIAKNITLASQFGSFTNVNRSLRSTDFIWVNQFTGKINSTINTVFQFDIMYDDDFSTELQVKQVLAVGLQFNLY